MALRKPKIGKKEKNGRETNRSTRKLQQSSRRE